MYRYIIIDDEALTRKGTMEKLSSMTDRVQCVGEANNGSEGIALIEDLHPDIVITDMKMPVMSGIRLLPLLAEQHPEIFIIVISGYQDFDYMREAVRAGAIDYVLKPFGPKDICAVMARTLERLASQEQRVQEELASRDAYEQAQFARDKESLYGMLEGYVPGSPEPESRRMRLLYKNRSVALITLHSDRAFSEEAINRFLAGNGYGDSILYLPHPHVPTMGFLLLSLPSGDIISAETYCRKVIRGISALFWDSRQPVAYGISSAHDTLPELAIARKETVQALNQLRQEDKDSVYFYRDSLPTARRITWEHTDELLFCMEAGRTEEVKRWVEQLFAFYRSIPAITLGDAKYSCYSVTDQVKYMMNRSIQALQMSHTEASIQNILDTLFSFDELETFYLQFYQNVAANLAQENIYSDADTVNNVRTYIDRYYQKNITVEFVASLFHVNRSYLSHIFKKKAGKSFIDYLNEVRIIHAKELLAKTDKKMYQIASLSGYNNVRYFFKAFKKVEGMTPEQYRKQQGV